jgi:hypothetical protein
LVDGTHDEGGSEDRPFTLGLVRIAGALALLLTVLGNGLASADPQFSPTGSMTNPRYEHTATLLGNGTVLVAGGWTSGYEAIVQQNPETGEEFLDWVFFERPGAKR